MVVVGGGAVIGGGVGAFVACHQQINIFVLCFAGFAVVIAIIAKNSWPNNNSNSKNNNSSIAVVIAIIADAVVIAIIAKSSWPNNDILRTQ